MSRSELQIFASGLYPPPCRVRLESRKFTCAVLVNGVEIASGSNWDHAYGDMRRRLDEREAEYQNSLG